MNEVDPIAADFAAVVGLPAEQRGQRIDVLVIEDGEAIRTFLRERAISEAETIMRPKAGA